MRPYLPEDQELIDGIMERLPGVIREKRAQDALNLGIAARFAWERKELGSKEAWLFAHEHGTPIVPPGHPGHPIEIIKRGIIPGAESKKSPITISRWPDGTHYYAKVNGEDVVDEKGREKWDTYGEAFKAAMKYETI